MNAVILGDYSLRSNVTINLQHLSLVQNGRDVLGPKSYAVNVPVFPHAVFLVVAFGASKKMAWINAGGCVAAVANLIPLGDMAYVQDIERPRGYYRPALNVEHPVARTVQASEPKPASAVGIRLVAFMPGESMELAKLQIHGIEACIGGFAERDRKSGCSHIQLRRVDTDDL